MKINNCPACGSANCTPIDKIFEFPAILFPIEKDKRSNVSNSELSFSCCLNCNHLFLDTIDEKFNNNIYKEYYYLYPFGNLESMQIAYRKPFEDVVDFFCDKSNSKVLEIGSDSEEHLEIFLNRGYKCTAINPGANNGMNVKFIDGFYGDCVIDDTFDYIVSRFNLEHIISFDKFFDALSKNLKLGGMAFFQVPNIEFFINSGLLNFFAHEHPQYFCKSSMKRLFDRYGYDVNYINSSSPSLICAVSKKETSKDRIQYYENTQKTLLDVKKLICSRGESTVLYGAGLSLTGLLYSNVSSDEFVNKVYVVDDNEILWGKYMPNTDIEIKSPNELNINTFKVIILTLASQYHDTVYKKLVNGGYVGEIYAITNNGLCKI